MSGQRVESRGGSGSTTADWCCLAGEVRRSATTGESGGRILNMKEHPTMLMKTRDMKNGMLEHPTISMKITGLFSKSHDIDETARLIVLL